MILVVEPDVRCTLDDIIDVLNKIDIRILPEVNLSYTKRIKT